MDKVNIMGVIALVITTVYTCFGMPVQIFKSIQHKSVSGLSLVNTCMMLLTFTSWVIYASLKTPPDFYVIISNAPGAICTMIILFLFGKYGKNKASLPQ